MTNLYGCLKQLNLLKKHHRHLKVLLSIGGWTYSSNFAQPAASAAGRRTFAQSAVQLVRDLGFDGLDVDWEYPQNEQEAGDYVSLLEETRRALDAFHKSNEDIDNDKINETGAAGKTGKMLLTVACPAGSQNYTKLHLRAMDRVLDFWNLMAYDYAGSWDHIAGHQANLLPDRQYPARTPFSTQAALDYYLTEGQIRPDKIVLGMPLYGRGFVGTDGLGSPFEGNGGEGSWEAGVWDFKALPKEGAGVHLDEVVGASWSHDVGKRTIVSFDDRRVAKLKAAYVKDRGLGGAMWWESSGDRSGEEGLIGTVS